MRIDQSGSKYWIFNYTRPFLGKRNDLSLGTYPEVSLEDARTIRDQYKKLIKQGIDPAMERIETKSQKQKEAENSFRVIAELWLHKRELEQKQDEETIRRLNHDVYPYIGDLIFPQLTLEILETKVFKRIVERGALSVAKRLKSDLNQIFKSARKKKLIQYNPIEDIELPKPQAGNFPAVTEEQDLAPMLNKIWNYSKLYPRCLLTTQVALKISVLTFQRPGEIRMLKKEFFYREERCFKFTASKTKQLHIVPLSDQAFDLIDSIIDLHPYSEYIFVGRDGKTVISDNTINSALKRLGYGGEQTAHGFRATARTMLDEILEQRVDFIEHQLAHKVKDNNGTAYNRTKFLNNRREMMQEWANYLESLLEL
ncbi:phage integrase family protein [Acinetobacter sp. 1281984]|nr:phage integrase family protein [Acinetobacter sp. 1281984]